MNAPRLMAFLHSPWSVILLVLVGLTLAAAHAPLVTMIGVLVLVAACALMRAFGVRRGLWYLLVASFPLRQALSVDIFGTASLFFGDVLLLGLFGEMVYRNGFRELWGKSATFKTGIVILGLSILSLYGASRAYWGIVSVSVIAQQMVIFYIARALIRSGREATQTLIAVLVGLVPAIIYGFYQVSLPYGAALPGWSGQFTAYGAGGEPHLRVFSTFGHPLRFSHYLSIGVGLSVGLAFLRPPRGIRVLILIVGLAAVYCNLFTYSVGGVLGMLAAVAVALVVGSGRRRTVLLVMAPVIVWSMFSHGVLERRIEHLLAGQSSSAAARLVTYQQSLNILRDHPVRGVGWGSIRSSLEGTYRMTRSHVVALCSENYFLQRGLALGVPGVILYALVMFLFLRNVMRSRRGPRGDPWPRTAILAGGVAFYVQAQVMPSTDASVNYLLWLLLAAAEAMHEAVGRRTIVACEPATEATP